MSNTIKATITEVRLVNGSIELEVWVNKSFLEKFDSLELLKLSKSDPAKYEKIKKNHEKQRAEFISSIRLGNIEFSYPKGE